MKKIVKIMTLVAASAMGFTACQKDVQEDYQPAEKTVVVNFVAQSADTKTSVNASGETPKFAWDDAETFAVLEQTDALAEAVAVTFTKEDGKAKIDAEFAANAGKGEYKYVTVYPETGYVSAESIGVATLSLPSAQTMAAGSYDPAADLMVSEIVTTSAQPTEAQNLSFTRLAAVAKMTLKNFNLAEGDEVEKVIFTAEGKDLAGTLTANLADPHSFTVSGGVDNVTVNTTSATDVYFTVLPAVLEAGNKYTVTVLTSKKLYIKQGTIGDGKSLTFEAGMVTRFGVDMAGIAPSDKWVLVKDASTLKQGDVVAIAAKDYDKALSTKLYSNASETSTSARRDAVDISKYHDYLIANENVQPFVLVSGSAVGTFSFYDETREKFLVSNNKTSRYLINQAYVDANTSFAITIDAETGDATVKNTEGEYTGCMIRYYNSSKYFYSGTSANQAICIYKQGGVTGEIPTVPANVTIPDEDEPVVIAEEGTAEATAINEVVFNYVGDWTITPSTEAEWLSVAYDATKKCLTYTADANTSTKRETSVKVTASLEGQESLTWTFNVLQKGVPQEITIAEFMTKGQDVNTAYKLTGRISEMVSSSDGTFKLTDGTNVATVTYLYTDGGDKVYGNTSIGLEVGDVVTLTTVVTSSTKGKGGSSAYHSIYKGHYGLKASAGVAVEYTGGTATIEVTTKNNGNIVLPGAVTAVMAENDFAELSYNGGDQATVTFASENTTSEAREAEVTFTYGMTSVVVTVQQGINPANKLGYELVTDASDLVVDDEIIIVAKNFDKALAKPSGTSATYYSAVGVTKTGNVIYDIEDTDVVIFTLVAGSNDDTTALKYTYNDEVKYLSATSSTGLRMGTSVGANTSFEIVVETDGNATIKNANKVVKYNSAQSAGQFSAWAPSNSNATKAENSICIYKKQVKQ